MLSPTNKKKIRKWVVFISSGIILVFVGMFIFQKIAGKKTRLITYPEFGIGIPVNYSIHGIDVSRYQHKISWEEVKTMNVQGISIGFAFIKATEGIGKTDPQYRRNWKKARKNGIIRGAYHFFIASKDGRMQAENFIDKVRLEKGDMPPVLDVEQLMGTSSLLLKKEIKKWLDIVENHYKVKPIIYTNVDFYNRYLGSEFDSYPLWVAHYYETHKPRIKRGWMFWQHSDNGLVNGIASKVDFNVFNGDSIEFKNLLKE